MSRFTNALIAAAISSATFAPAGASEAGLGGTARQGVTVPAVISVAYRNPRIAMSAGDVSRQGGFAIAGATRWMGPDDRAATGAAFAAPGVISVAYADPRIVTDAAGVLRQGGLATAGAVRWVSEASVVADAKPDAFRLGAL